MIEKPRVKRFELPDGDIIGMIGPLDSSTPYTHIYINNDTISLDRLFGMEKKPLSSDDERRILLERCSYPGTLGSIHAEKTIMYFTLLAQNAGMFIGLREEEIKKEMPALHLEETLNQKHSGGPYLIRKNIEGHNVIFPTNLEIWPF